MTMNLGRTESAYLAEEACQIFEDAQKRLGSKMIQEFKFCDDIKQLCIGLCELEQFRCFTPKQLQRYLKMPRKTNITHRLPLTRMPGIQSSVRINEKAQATNPAHHTQAAIGGWQGNDHKA
jgi:hypothetical protein